MWFLFALVTALCWGCADLFYKEGSLDESDRLSHLKLVVTVGLVMGIHGVLYMIICGISFDPFQMVRYFPVSAMYILSMAIGYVGFRYLEVSIASPVGNSSGALTAILCFCFLSTALGALEIVSIILITGGVLLLAILEKRDKNEVLHSERVDLSPKYRVGVLAILFPILYAVFDSLGTFADALYLDEFQLISEDDALLAYEFTFFICAVLCYFYIRVVKRQRFNLWREREKVYAALFETGGQFFYVFAMAENAIVAAPLVGSYSIFSMLLSRIFLKEKLSKAQYAVVFVVMVGIVLMGIADEL